MAIPGICPECGAKFPLEQALTDGDARQALATALSLHPLGKDIVRYMSLHAPPGKSVQFRKLTRLLTELIEMVKSGEVTRKGVSYSAPLELWAIGFNEVERMKEQGNLTLPLPDHAYLAQVIWSHAAKGVAQQQIKQERQHASRAGAADHPVPPVRQPPPPRSRPTPADRAETRKTAQEHLAKARATIVDPNALETKQELINGVI